MQVLFKPIICFPLKYLACFLFDKWPYYQKAKIIKKRLTNNFLFVFFSFQIHTDDLVLKQVQPELGHDAI